MNANDLRRGMAIKFNNSLCVVLDTEHIKPGKGGAYVQVTMRDLKSGRTLNNRFRSQESVDVARLDGKKAQFLYKDGSGYHFMDLETYETITLPEEFVGDNERFLVPELEVEIEFYENEPVILNLPTSIDVKVVETVPGERGNSVSNVQKPAKIETGYTLNVPLFIEEGEMIKVDTRTGKYLGRA